MSGRYVSGGVSDLKCPLDSLLNDFLAAICKGAGASYSLCDVDSIACHSRFVSILGATLRHLVTKVNFFLLQGLKLLFHGVRTGPKEGTRIGDASHRVVDFVRARVNPALFQLSVEEVDPMATIRDAVIDQKLDDHFKSRVLASREVLSGLTHYVTEPFEPVWHCLATASLMLKLSFGSDVLGMALRGSSKPTIPFKWAQWLCLLHKFDGFGDRGRSFVRLQARHSLSGKTFTIEASQHLFQVGNERGRVRPESILDFKDLLVLGAGGSRRRHTFHCLTTHYFFY